MITVPNAETLVDHIASVAFQGWIGSSIHHHVQPVVARGDLLVERSVVHQIASNWFCREFIEGHVRIECSNDPIAILRQFAVMIVMHTIGVRISHQVQPIPRHVLAVLRHRQESVDQSLVSVRRLVCFEFMDRLTRGRQAVRSRVTRRMSVRLSAWDCGRTCCESNFARTNGRCGFGATGR